MTSDRTIVTIGSGRDEIRASAVIVAVPWHALDDVFRPAPPSLIEVLAAAANVASSAIVTVNFWLAEPLGLGTFVGLPGRTFQWLFDKRELLGAGFSHVSMVSSGADALVGKSNEQIIELAWQELLSAAPRLRSARFRRATAIRERSATFSVAPGSPARPAMASGIDGVYLAGDWIETLLPATIEGAVASGHRAATAVLARSRSLTP